MPWAICISTVAAISRNILALPEDKRRALYPGARHTVAERQSQAEYRERGHGASSTAGGMELACDQLESHSPTRKMRVGWRAHRSNGFCERRSSPGIYETKPTSSLVFIEMILRVDARNALSRHLRELKSERARDDDEPRDSERRLPKRERSKKRVLEQLTQSRELSKQMQAG
jgi:hypothetical protein